MIREFTKTPPPRKTNRSVPCIQRKDPANFCWSGPQKTAATYSPTWWGSTIGDGELNFSVRNGKRWILTAITTAIYYLRENNFNNLLSTQFSSTLNCDHILCPRERYRAISTGQLNTLLCVHFLPINVVVSHDPQGNLISQTASRLDAFSAYPDPTWVPGDAAGATTGMPEVGPTRSSRTKVSPSQVSCAHNR